MPRDYRPGVTPPNLGRRPELALNESQIAAFLARAAVGQIATAWDGQPFINTTTFWHDAANRRIVFHSNIVGRVRANAEHNGRVCFSASEFGRLLPSNIALEFSIQYESVVIFGTATVLTDAEAQRAALYGLIGKYFPAMRPGTEFRPITDQELKRTSVYAIAIEHWSGKRNWVERAVQSDEWPPLAEEWFA
jgi:nitroimidazol reductase NimA-like FMN-containing flavoprotein (pyridoxamine 5'-phosphate oxidase superfamily)